MGVVSLRDVRAFVHRRITHAVETAQRINLTENRRERKQLSRDVRAATIEDIPRFRRIDVGFAAKAWAAVLFVDMRESSSRAQVLGPFATFVTMHAFLPTMAYLVSCYGGQIVGYRGDGLFAAFGIDETTRRLSAGDKEEGVRAAFRCGEAMVEAVGTVINPTLSTKLDGYYPFEVGCGISCGRVVVTRIGIERGSELTAYGNAVNKASKLCSVGAQQVILSSAAVTHVLARDDQNADVYFAQVDGKRDCVLVYPDHLRELG